MKRFVAVLSLIFTFAFSTLGMAQSRRYATEQSWMENFRVVTGVGTMNFLGDLGGSNDIGRSFLADWDWEAVRPVIQVGARYQWHRRFATRASFNFGWTVGKDAGLKIRPGTPEICLFIRSTLSGAFCLNFISCPMFH